MTTLQADDIAHYLTRHQDFFEQHPQLLSQMQLPNPHDGQAISLVERQSLMLRERVKSLESRVAEMVRNGQENEAIAEKLIAWVRALLTEKEQAALPATLIDELKQIFEVPYAALRLWSTQPAFVGTRLRTRGRERHDHICQQHARSILWIERRASKLPRGSGPTASSTALRCSRFALGIDSGADPETFGMLVLGSADPERFDSSMGTAFLERIAELASAALARLSA